MRHLKLYIYFDVWETTCWLRVSHMLTHHDVTPLGRVIESIILYTGSTSSRLEENLYEIPFQHEGDETKIVRTSCNCSSPTSNRWMLVRWCRSSKVSSLLLNSSEIISVWGKLGFIFLNRKAHCPNVSYYLYRLKHVINFFDKKVYQKVTSRTWFLILTSTSRCTGESHSRQWDYRGP
jgi:hypothetical protein